MKPDAPSLTARGVALARASYDRPSSPTGDPAAERRLAESLAEGLDLEALQQRRTRRRARGRRIPPLPRVAHPLLRRGGGAGARSRRTPDRHPRRGLRRARLALPHTRRALLRGGPSRDASRQASPPRASRRVARRHHVRHGRLHGSRARGRARRGRARSGAADAVPLRRCAALPARARGSTSCCVSPRSSPRRAASSR